MKVLTAEQMRAVDAATFSQTGVASIAVMESAGRAVTQLLVDRFPQSMSAGVVVACGGGNNGGDGYVIARALTNLGVPVAVLSIKPVAELGGDALANFKAWSNLGGSVLEVRGKQSALEDLEGDLSSAGLIVDAIFGTGFQGTPKGEAAEAIQLINRTSLGYGVPVVAVDLPSGVDASNGKVSGSAVYATITVALQFLKIGHLLYPGAAHTGEVFVADIGLTESLANVEGGCSLIEYADVSAELLGLGFSNPQAHKGDRGRVLVIGGSRGMYGAAKMSAYAALLSGAGLSTVALPNEAARIVGPTLEELMSIGVKDDGDGGFAADGFEGLSSKLSSFDSLVIGPGMGQSADTASFLGKLLDYLVKSAIPVVLDADALNLVASDKALQKKVTEKMVLTPHPGEMARLLGVDIEVVQSDRLGSATKLSAKLGATVILKGARSVVCSPEGEISINPAATDVLGTAGSGDVLSGLIGALLARGLSPFKAAQCGVFIHGAAGEVLESALSGPVGGTAMDIAEAFPAVINDLLQAEPERFALTKRVLPGSLSSVKK